jgi:hypothetical protein
MCGATGDVRHVNAALIVKRMHRIQTLTEPARWHGNLHDEWKVASDGLAAWSAFVASTAWSTFLASGHFATEPA